MYRMVTAALVFLLATAGCRSGAPIEARPGPVKVEIVATEGGFELLRGGRPYVVKGAGIEFGDVAAFAAHGGNSFRTWRTDNGVETGQQVLDKALAHGLTVAMALPVIPERHGFDYDDDAAVAAQLERMRQEVLKYRDHPALLVWIIGNELNHESRNPRVYDAVNDISRMIHELDPNHPTTTTTAGFSKELATLIATRAPDLDFLSIQMYGDLVNLPRYLDEAGFDGPYFVTEWGATGHWEVARTGWGAPIEQDSSAKAASYLKSYRQAIEPRRSQGIASYVFLWGQKQERTPTWYGLFTETGEETEAIDVMHFIWNGAWPENRSPQLGSMTLDGRAALQGVRLSAGRAYPAAAVVTDPDGDPVRYFWQLRHEARPDQVGSGGDKEEVPEEVTGVIADATTREITLTAPSTPGPYRLFLYAYDGRGHAAHANIPFYVDP